MGAVRETDKIFAWYDIHGIPERKQRDWVTPGQSFGPSIADLIHQHEFDKSLRADDFSMLSGRSGLKVLGHHLDDIFGQEFFYLQRYLENSTKELDFS